MDWEKIARELQLEIDKQKFDELPERPSNWEPGDFYSDGVLMCGQCGNPKESVYVNDDGSVVKFPIYHDHQLRNQKEDALNIVERIQRRRRQCFAGEFMELGRECRWDDRDADTQPEAVDAVERFVRTMYENKNKNMGRGLIIYGHNGRGKTYVAGCLCNLLLDKDYKVLMTSTRRLRSQVDERFGSRNDMLMWLCGFDVVCLDDMFADRNTDTGREFVFDVVDALYLRRVPVVATTNMSRDYLTNPSDKDKPTIDRLKERCEKLEMTGRNRRQGRL